MGVRSRTCEVRGGQEEAGKILQPFNKLKRTWGHGPFVARICCRLRSAESSSLQKILCSSKLFSSPELKAQVSFSDRLSSVVCLSVNFSYFRLLLQNHWANFNQTWHKASLGEGDSSQMKGPALFQGEIIKK